MSDPVALITGGTGGLGTAICKALSLQGCRVYANHLPLEQEQALAWQAELKRQGFVIDLAAADVADFASVTGMLAQVRAEAGQPVQVLVNCAGITRDATLKKMSPEQWLAVINTNLNSIYNVTSQVIGPMLDTGFGRIVNISSVSGHQGNFGQTNYSAAKAGVHGFSMALARETAASGITVNTISPGFIETSMTAAVPDQVQRKIVAAIPMGRMGRPHEVAHLVAFLCSQDSSYITGANIPVNGGMHMEF